MQYIQRFTLLVCVLCLSVSCEDIIDLDLNTANPQIVIEGTVSSWSNRQEVRISKTVSFTDESTVRPVSDAIVSVTDQEGRVYLFTEETPGLYVNLGFRGRQNWTYQLNVRSEGEEYHASSTLPALVPVDTITVSTVSIFNEMRRIINLHFQDPANEQNFYRFKMQLNGGEPIVTGVSSDKFYNGRYLSHEIFDFDNPIAIGDRVTIYRYHIDAAVYDYWDSLASLNPGTASPANPNSNISNGALGYFSAHSVIRFDMTIVEEE